MRQSRLFLLGVILVAVPVVFQFALMIWMTSMLWSIQQDALDARQSRNRLNFLSDCLVKLSDLSFIVFSHDQTSDKEVHNEVAQSENEIMALLDKASYDAASNAQVERIRQATRQLTSLTTWALHQGRMGDTLEERLAITPRLSQAGDKFTAEITKLIEMEKKSHPQLEGISPAYRATVQYWLIISMAISVLFSAIMAVFFAARIKVPISRISENLKLLSDNKPLLPASNSKDELGSLDRLIHSVSNEFNNALVRERSLIEKAADLICSLDETGTFLTVNSMAMGMLGMRAADLTGKDPEKNPANYPDPQTAKVPTKLNELTVPEDSFAADELVRRSITSNDFQTAELRLRKSDGTILETRWSCLWSDEESSLFCVAHDITQEKELAQMKQDFMNMISHDLRSPLTSVMGGLTILTTGIKGELAPGLRKEAESAIKSSEKLVSFINDLLDFQKLNTGQMPLELKSNKANDLIDEAIQLVSALAKDRSIDLQFNKESEKFKKESEKEFGKERSPVSIMCDRQKTIQVILNLLSNAIKFSPKGSVVVVEVEDRPDSVRFSVSDSGPGVPEEMRLRIFEPFEQIRTTAQAQGTGLGLAICKMIVEAHGGSIGVGDRQSTESNQTSDAAAKTEGTATAKTEGTATAMTEGIATAMTEGIATATTKGTATAMTEEIATAETDGTAVAKSAETASAKTEAVAAGQNAQPGRTGSQFWFALQKRPSIS